MNERRRFLQVLGGGVAAIGAGCGSNVANTGGSGGGGGQGGAGTTSSTTDGTTSSTTDSTTTTTTSATTSTTSGNMGCETMPTGKKLGMPSEYMDGLNILQGQKVIIGKDSGGYYALTAICTHSSCNMDAQGKLTTSGGQQVIRCTCHGSEFFGDGSVAQGPAGKPLKAYALALGCDGFLYVDTATVVPSAQRLVT